MMKVTLSCVGRFHHFDLARELHAAGWLDRIHTGYPRFKLRDAGLPAEKIDTFPWLQTLYMAQARWPRRSVGLGRALERAAERWHDAHVAQVLRPCDVFVGLSGHNTQAGQRAQALGARWICDRGSSHIVYQDKMLREEHARWGIPFSGVPSWAMEAEQIEYASCDLITVPSTFAANTFLAAGFPASKVKRIPYGVDLTRFTPVAIPPAGRFDVMFVGNVGVQKGIPYLIEAFRNFRHPRKSLKIIGAIEPAFRPWVRQVRAEGVEFLGPRPQDELKEHLSRSHLFVLPSVQDGFGMVLAQAMACGCPAVATVNTGGPDLISPGEDGFIVPIRDAAALTAVMHRLADEPQLRERMGLAARASVLRLGGWSAYGSAFRSTLVAWVHG
jgi:glycosyltransferase involved in cell wall biosynthesis